MKKNVKSWMALALCIALLLTVAGCSGNNGSSDTSPSATATDNASSDSASSGAEGEGLVYGYISPGPDTWYIRNVEGFQLGAEEAGAEVIVLNSNYDVNQEIANIDSLINQGVDGICIFSFNESGAITAAEKCAKAGIPLVATDSVGSVFDATVDVAAAIDFDWEEMGVCYADWMAENCPDEDYVIITGNFESVPCQVINEAMTNKSEELGQNNCLDIRSASYTPSTAADIAQDLVSSGLEFSILFVMDEDMAAAVITRLEDMGVMDQYTVIAQNGSTSGLPLVKAGTLKYTISSSPGWEGLISFKALEDAVVNNAATGKQIMLPIMEVTAENIDDPMKVVPWEVDADVYWDLTKEYFPEYAKS